MLLGGFAALAAPLGPGAFQELDLRAAYGGVAAWGQTVHPESRHVELMAQDPELV